jgi:hypothetical protein
MNTYSGLKHDFKVLLDFTAHVIVVAMVTIPLALMAKSVQIFLPFSTGEATILVLTPTVVCTFVWAIKESRSDSIEARVQDELLKKELLRKIEFDQWVAEVKQNN